MNKCIVTQIHIPPFDIQGGLTANDKQEITDVSIKHLRKYNPDAYIILTGHGESPYKETLDLCDWIYWEDQCRPLNEYGYIPGMPAQFFFVSIGIKQAKKMGFEYTLKTRTDSIIGVPDIVPKCHEVLEKEQKLMLITQQTWMSNYHLGDCFMYAPTAVLDHIWDYRNPVLVDEGLKNTGMNYAKTMGSVEEYAQPERWQWLLKQTCAFRNVTWMKYLDMRWNFVGKFKSNWTQIKEDILNNAFDFNEYYWGKACGWHLFEGKMDVLHPNGPHYCEATFYNV